MIPQCVSVEAVALLINVGGQLRGSRDGAVFSKRCAGEPVERVEFDQAGIAEVDVP